MRFGSVCSGIEAASVAWHPLGWRASWLAEIEPFPSAVLAYRYPDVPNLGDMTTIPTLISAGLLDAPDIIVGGTPCQAFSVAGLRAGLSDPRGALTISYVEIINNVDTARAAEGKEPCIAVWENVPGVLSSADNAFGCFLGALAGEGVELEPGPPPESGKSSRYWRWDKVARRHVPRWPNAGVVAGPQRTIAWRVLDAQYFGVAQRRRRVFVVASSRKGFNPVEVLFEFDGVRRDTKPRRAHEATENTAATPPVPFDMVGFGQYGSGETASTCKQRAHKDATDLVVVIHGTQDPNVRVDGAHTLGRNSGQENAVFVDGRVRRLTPIECERLQGFEDGYTDIPRKVIRDGAGLFGGPCVKRTVTATIVTPAGVHYVATNACTSPQAVCPRGDMPTGVGYELCASVCGQPGHAEIQALRLAGKKAAGATLYLEGHTYVCPSCAEACLAAGITATVIGTPPGGAPDGPRYKALGNSMAVPCMAWIGHRIQLEALGL